MQIPISNRKKLILSIDDFGLDKKTNARIFKLIELGKIDRVAVMIGGKISDEEVTKLLRSGIRIDIHLDIYRTAHMKKDPYEGVFLRVIHFLLKYLNGSIKTSSVHKSWKKQIDLFHDRFGKYPDGINSHEHVHFFPRYFHIVRLLQEHYSIPYLRFGKRDILGGKTPVAIILRVLHGFNMKGDYNQYLISSDHLVSLNWIKDIEKFLSNLPQGSIEIVCHSQKDEEFAILLKSF